jgi:hypothetical protein
MLSSAQLTAAKCDCPSRSHRGVELAVDIRGDLVVMTNGIIAGPFHYFKNDIANGYFQSSPYSPFTGTPRSENHDREHATTYISKKPTRPALAERK